MSLYYINLYLYNINLDHISHNIIYRIQAMGSLVIFYMDTVTGNELNCR